jgi:iron(III) transport system substrate-binding protein
MMPVRALIALPAALLAVLAGCGGGDRAEEGGVAATAAAVETLRGAKRERALAQRGRAEPGALRFYTSLEEDVAKLVGREFERATAIKVEVFRAKSEELLERVSKEQRAGVGGADVVETGGPGLVVLDRQGTLAPYEPPARAMLVPASAYGGWTVDRFNVFVVSWNTDRVPAAQRPRSHADLAAARWRGRVAMEADDVDWYFGLREHWTGSQGLTDAAATGRFEAIARNARVIEGHALMDELVGAGEFDAAVSDYSYLVEKARQQGAPIGWKPATAPVLARPNGIAVVRGTRRPAKALLFVDWLLGPGQQLLAREKIDPARRDLATRAGVETLRIDPERFVDAQHRAAQEYGRIVRLAGKRPSD